MHGKGVSQPVRADIMNSSGLRIHQFWQSRFFGAVFYNLPRPMSVDAKDKPFSVSYYRAAPLNVFLEHVESLTVNWQNSLAPMLLLLSLSLLDLTAALWAKGVTSAKPLPTPSTGQLETSFQMFDGNNTLIKVYILDFDGQGFADPTAEVEQEANKKLEDVKSDSRLKSKLNDREKEVIPGIIGALKFQIEQWTQGMSGLNLKNDLITEPAEEGFVNLRYGFSQMGKVKKEHVRVIHDVLEDWESRLKQWEEYQKLEKSFIELRRVEKNLRDELAVITLRRIVPGRCKYCPL